MPTTDDRAVHIRRRNAWAFATAVTFFGAIALRPWAPSLAPFLVAGTSWLWGVVGFSYQQGWLRRDAHETSAKKEAN